MSGARNATGLVVLSEDLAAVVKTTLNERGGVRTDEDTQPTEALDSLAHGLAHFARGALTFDSAVRRLYRIRTCESPITRAEVADQLMLAAEKSPWEIAELPVFASNINGARQMVEAYALHREWIPKSEWSALARKLHRFSAGVIEAYTDEEHRERNRRTAEKRKARRKELVAA